jgi:hypothetical protein
VEEAAPAPGVRYGTMGFGRREGLGAAGEPRGITIGICEVALLPVPPAGQETFVGGQVPPAGPPWPSLDESCGAGEPM